MINWKTCDQVVRLLLNQSRRMSVLKEVEDFATNKLEPALRDYLNKGAQNDVTLNANREAFDRLRIRPRFMVDVSKRDLSIKLFGDTIPMPICVSPFGLSRRFHKDGEYETAKGLSICIGLLQRSYNLIAGVGLSGTVMVVSSGSSVSIEEIAEAEPNLVKWFQLFIFKDRNITLDMARRAQKAGYKAIALTVDQTVMGIRYQNIKNQYEDKDERVNYRPYGVTKNVALDATWQDIKWLKQNIDIPLVLKGILTAEDAKLAVESGADAVFVSNHGARQVDGAVATVRPFNH